MPSIRLRPSSRCRRTPSVCATASGAGAPFICWYGRHTCASPAANQSTFFSIAASLCPSAMFRQTAPTSLDAFAAAKLDHLQAAGLRRTLAATRRLDGLWVERGGRRLLSFSCNDYLNL